MPSTALPLGHRFAGRLHLFGLMPTVVAVLASMSINGYRTYRSETRQIEAEPGQTIRLVASDFGLRIRLD
jgi:hypothetical protein